jgi:hypothetical protein
MFRCIEKSMYLENQNSIFILKLMEYFPVWVFSELTSLALSELWMDS